MKKIIFCLIFLSFQSFAQNIKIDQAVLALPENQRVESTVIDIDKEGNEVILRAGSNDMICLADDDNIEGFSVACYHKNLEPFMKRGRELKKEGLSFQEIFDKREEEAKSGKLVMPDHPSTLSILSGKNIDDATLRWVVYIPFETSESTGLPLAPTIPGAPWIMNPGTHRAHIMISPPN